MNTIKLYETDSMLCRFECKVTSCEKQDDNYKIMLDQTAFFPEGGGQTCDTGVIGDANVFDVQEIDGEIYHFTNIPLTVGETYLAAINFDERFDKMQNHSGEHIVSGIINNKFGYHNVGFHLSDSVVTCDFDGMLTRDDLDEIEILANKAIWANTEIKAYYPSTDELKNTAYRSKLDLQEGIRLVEIVGVDTCACCAPHVKTTGQIGAIKLLQCEKNKGGVRIFMKCGMRALNDYQSKYNNAAEISALLCAKQDEIADAVKTLLADKDALKYEITGLRRQVIDLKIAATVPTEGNICIIDKNLTADDMRYFANNMVSKCKIVVIFSRNEKGFNYICASNSVNLRDFGKQMNDALNGKGGGSPNMIQGSVACEKAEIEKFFSANY
ncbi:MAG: hypothetical protein E7531_04315 [Ruminococcaceae bacterium]|nr:hypothetical protein [Oscillospiraceae bacterium]